MDTLFQIGFVTNLASCALSLFLPESPIFLWQKGRFQEAHESIEAIARVNNCKVNLPRFKPYIESQSPKESNFMSQPDIRFNLAIMAVVWLTSSFNYYLVGYLLKYFPGSIYMNSCISVMSELISLTLSGFVYQALGPRITLTFFFSISTIGGLLILIFHFATNTFGESDTSILLEGYSVPSYVFPVLVLIAKFGTSAGFNLAYVANAEVFPPLFQGTAMGMCNFFARAFTSLAPVVAEIIGYTPMLVFTMANVFAILCIIQLRVTDKSTQKETI